MNWKPQDVVVALKPCGYPNGRPPISVVAGDLGLSPSEVHGAMQRLRSSRVLQGPALKDRPNISGLEEFLVPGLKYAFPAKHGEVTRGIAISYAAEPLKSEKQ
jgi:DNA-binding Lrp family transcriptional regulator